MGYGVAWAGVGFGMGEVAGGGGGCADYGEGLAGPRIVWFVSGQVSVGDRKRTRKGR